LRKGISRTRVQVCLLGCGKGGFDHELPTANRGCVELVWKALQQLVKRIVIA
jgi:hypothetical protein